jgi:flagellar hook-length control protein FliK
MNFSDLSSIGAGAAVDSDGRAADIARMGGAQGVPPDEAVESDSDREEGEFGALLDLLALATQAALPPAASRSQEAVGPTPGTLESLTVKQRRAVDVTEIFRQVTALAATTEPEPSPDASLAFPALDESGHEQGPSPVEVASLAAGAGTARTADAAREARALVEQAMAAARKAAAAEAVPTTDSKPVSQPLPAATTIAPEAASTKDVAVVARQKVDVEVAQPVDTTAPPAEQRPGDVSELATVPKLVTAAVAQVVPDKAAAAEPAAAVPPNAVAAAPEATTSSSLLGENASQGDGESPDGERAPSGQSGGARQSEATVIEPFSPQLAAKIYESAAAAASSPSPEVGELADVVPQIVRSIHLQSAGDVGHARVQLRPEHLGEVLVELRVEQGEVIASLEADVPAVREWIEARANELKEALGAQGLELLHFSVRDREERRREEPPEQQQPRKQKRHARSTEAVRFELPAA